MAYKVFISHSTKDQGLVIALANLLSKYGASVAVAEWSLASGEAKVIFRRVDNFEEHVFIPCIALFELVYLTEKKKIAANFDQFLQLVLGSNNYRVEPLCLPIIQKSREIPRGKLSTTKKWI